MTLAACIDIPEDTLNSIRTIAEARSDSFIELVEVAKLNKRTDFAGMSFAEMNLDGLELRGFNFRDADFRDCSLNGTVFFECELKGAAFSFPPDIRGKWTQDPDIFLGSQQSDTLELMRIAAEGSRKEERKEAAGKLLKFKEDPEVESFLQGLSLDDKAKSLRSWLRGQLTGSSKEESSLKAILERSLFEGGQDLDDDISLYVRMTNGSDIAVETLCHACSNNPRAIKKSSQELSQNESFKRFLINCLSFSDSYAWREAATALDGLHVAQAEMDAAFAKRLARSKAKRDLSHLAENAALNGVRLPKLFELSENGYRTEPERWRADDYLLYCYFYDQGKYRNDVLFYAFNGEATEEMTPYGAFGAYCLVHQPELYRAVKDEWSYFGVDPLALLGLRDSFDSDRLPPDMIATLKQVSQEGYEQARSIRPENIIRRRAARNSL